MAEHGLPTAGIGAWSPPASIDEARARARERFKSRLEAGQEVGKCGCGDDDAVAGERDGSPPECVVGVRFRDSGRVYYFLPEGEDLRVGDWVVVPTGRGLEAGRVVIAPHQVRRALLQGELGRVTRRLDEFDVAQMERQKQEGAEAVRLFSERCRQRQLGIKAIAADYTFDGAAATLSYSVPDRERSPDANALRELARELASDLGCRVELRQVGPRDEARLLGGLGRCGRTLCCSSWLPVFPEISMSMAKNQDLPLNPAKVSGVCGRLLCCLSYENEQYRQMKAVMPKLGQAIDTPDGRGQVISMQLMKELVTVRLDQTNIEATFRSEDLGFAAPHGQTRASGRAKNADPDAVNEGIAAESIIATGAGEHAAPPQRRRRRRRSGRRGSGSA